MKTYDFEYTHDGLFTTIYPGHNGAAKELARFMDSNDGSNKILTQQFPQFCRDARTAGYSVGGLPKHAALMIISDDALLAKLAR